MPHIPAVIPRESGVSSTPWLIGSITAVSGYWFTRLRGWWRL